MSRCEYKHWDKEKKELVCCGEEAKWYSEMKVYLCNSHFEFVWDCYKYLKSTKRRAS